MRANSRLIIQLGSAILASVLAILLPLHFLSNEQCLLLVKYASYWMLLVTSLLALYFSYDALRPRFNRSFLTSLRRHWPAALIILAASCFLHSHSEGGFKILFDEHVLSATAQSMAEEQLSYVRAAQHVINEDVVRAGGFVDKRPGLFPFLLSLVHNLTGNRPENVFWLNSVLCSLLLGLIYAVVTRFASPGQGILAVLLFTSLPLLAQNATGGGYELLNLCLICGLILAGYKYLGKEGSDGLNLLVILSVLLANSRYESILYTLVPVCLFLLKSIRRREFALTWFASTSPLLLITPVLSYRVFTSEPRFIRTTPDDFFSFHHFGDNLAHAITYLFEPSGDYSNSVLLSTAGVIAMLLLLVQVMRRYDFFRKQDIYLTVNLVVFSIASCLTILALSCFWGEWTDPMTSRFSLPLQLFFALCVPLALRYDLRMDSAPRWALVLTGLFILTQTAPHTQRMATEPRMVATEAYNWALEWIQSQPDTSRTLFLSESAVSIGLYQQSAIPFRTAAAAPERVLWSKERSIYDRICAVEILYHDGKGNVATPKTYQALSPRFQKTMVAERLLTPNILVRISEISGLLPAEPGKETLAHNMPPPPPPREANIREWEAYFLQGLPLVHLDDRQQP